jgi:AcrR family transcriptional regulator
MSRGFDVEAVDVVCARLSLVTVVDLRAETRAFGRARLRELALDAARDVVLARGWGAVRMGAIATAIGISRQSLHGEFGTKDELGDALVLRETAAFLDGVAARLAEHPGDLAGGVADAVEFMLTATLDDPLLQTILTRAPVNGGDQSLLPLLTTRGEPLIEHAMDIVGEQWPEADPDDARLMVETVVRLAHSHLLTQARSPSESARDLALVACRCLRMPDPPR